MIDRLEHRSLLTAALLSDLNPGLPGSDFSIAVAVGNQFFFVASDGSTGSELWKSDGTGSGTMRVADILPGP
jgi:ELWxxDGT repeat protein